MEKEYKVSFLKVMLFIIALFIVLGLIWYLVPKNKKENNNVLTSYITNINIMKEAGFEYFKGSNLPTKIGASNTLSLGEMIDSKLIVEFYDEENKACDKENSYIKATKQLDNEYSLKVYLKCNHKEDYIVTTISNDVIACLDCGSSSNSNNSNSEDQNKVDNSINNSYNNTTNNYGNSTSYPTSNNKPSSSNTGTHITNYNINYVNTCNCNTSNCNSCKSDVLYSVYFETNGGSYIPRQIVKHGDTASFVTSYREGYEFLGWYVDQSLTTKFDFNTPITNTTTLYAKWQKTNKTLEFTVDFDSNGGTSVPSQKVTDGNPATIPANPTRPCYRFLGWYLNGIKYDFNNPVRGNITLTAKWEEDGSRNKPVNNYQITFDSNGGSYVNSETIAEGNYATRPTNPTRNCYRFVAWHVNSLNGAIYNFNTPVYSNIHLVAEWEDDGSCRNTYRVTFDSNGGSYVSPKNVLEGNYVSIPTNPVRTGYRFVGWYYNNREFNFNTRIYQNYTLIAKWEKEAVLYNKYCKVEEERHYSVSWVAANTSSSVNWTIRFDQITNATNLKITDYGYLTTTSDYDKATTYSKYKPISKVGGNNGYSVSFGNSATLRNYSLKPGNFTPYLSNPYKSGNTWYVNASYNYSSVGLTPYYASNLKSYIHFVPFYFDIKYTNNNNCVTDLASNSRNYRNYEVVDSYYR